MTREQRSQLGKILRAIADQLRSALIAAQTKNLHALRTHKTGLMQRLLPSPEAMGA